MQTEQPISYPHLQQVPPGPPGSDMYVQQNINVMQINLPTFTGVFCRKTGMFLLYEMFAAMIWVALVATVHGTGAIVDEFVAIVIALATLLVMHMRVATGNPTVLLADVFSGDVTIIAFFLGIIAQLAGALLGAVVVNWGLSVSVGAAVPVVVAPFPSYSAFIAELILSTLFISMYLSHAKASNPRMYILVIGAGLCAATLAFYPISRACLNPWYHLATAIISVVWSSDCWVYYVGDFVGALLGLLIVWFFGHSKTAVGFWKDFQKPAPAVIHPHY